MKGQGRWEVGWRNGVVLNYECTSLIAEGARAERLGKSGEGLEVSLT